MGVEGIVAIVAVGRVPRIVDHWMGKQPLVATGWLAMVWKKLSPKVC